MAQVLNVGSTAAAAAASSSSSGAASLASHVSRPLPREARWRLAMWDCIRGHNSWSSAYSVLSVLLQLQGAVRPPFPLRHLAIVAMLQRRCVCSAVRFGRPCIHPLLQFSPPPLLPHIAVSSRS